MKDLIFWNAIYAINVLVILYHAMVRHGGYGIKELLLFWIIVLVLTYALLYITTYIVVYVINKLDK